MAYSTHLSNRALISTNKQTNIETLIRIKSILVLEIFDFPRRKMASYRTNTDPKAIENNYSKRLSIFANKLHQHTNVLKQQLSEMRRINTSLLGKLQQIRRLNNPMTL